jgi:hypothetical protein
VTDGYGRPSATLDDAVAALNPTKRIKAKRIKGKTIVRVHP